MQTQENPGYKALRRGRQSLPGCAYHLRTSLQSASSPALVGASAATVTDCLLSWQESERALLVAFVVMPDHVHVLAVLLGDLTIEQTFGRWKRWCTREVNRCLGRDGSVWQSGFFDYRIRREDDIAAIGRYIEHNPVRREMVSTAEEFPYCSANPRFRVQMRGREWLVGDETMKMSR